MNVVFTENFLLKSLIPVGISNSLDQYPRLAKLLGEKSKQPVKVHG